MISARQPPLHLFWPVQGVTELCRRWAISELSLFGSALRDDFGPTSDIDLLVKFQPGARWSLLDHARIELELEKLLGREVDLVTRDAIEGSPNWIVRDAILGSARPIYAG